MKIAIVGGQDYALTEGDYRFLKTALRLLEKATIVTDGEPGFSAAAETWALHRRFPVMRIPADRACYGKEAVAFNHGEMVRRANAVIAFPGGPETDALVAKAKAGGVSVFVSPSRLGSVAEKPEPPWSGPRVST